MNVPPRESLVTDSENEAAETRGPRTGFAIAGITLNPGWVAVLFGICATDGGHFRNDWHSCILWCSIMALPALLATIGLMRRQASFTVAAASLCAPLVFISLAGAGLPMIVPGVLYALASRGQEDNADRRRFGAGYLAMAVVMLFLGFIGMFSVGVPFFLMGIVMLAAAPFVGRAPTIVTIVLVALAAATVLYTIFQVAEARCVRSVEIVTNSEGRQVHRVEPRSC